MFRNITLISILIALLLFPSQQVLFAAPPAVPVHESGPTPLLAPALPEQEQLDLLSAYLKQTRETEIRTKGKSNMLEFEVLDIKELPMEYVASEVNLAPYVLAGRSIYPAYAKVRYKVEQENKYSHNGVNFRLVIFLKENGTWKVDQFVVAPVHEIFDRNIGFGPEDQDEVQLAEIFRRREQGIYTTPSGAVLDQGRNFASEEDLQRELRGTPPNMPVSRWVALLPDQVNAYYKRPKTIKVLMTTPENKAFYNCQTDCTQTIDFMEYLTHALPFQWPRDAPPEALKAAALQLKMYAWHAVQINPFVQEADTDVRDSGDNPTYRANYQPRNEAERARIEQIQRIFNAPGIAGVAFKDSIAHDMIHADFTTRSDRTRGSGILSIPGAIQLAREGKTAPEILNYYYRDSDKLEDSASVIFFRYAK